MAWFNLFSGPSAEQMEKKGDALGAAGFWGEAKLKYEGARRKLGAATDPDRMGLCRLDEKIANSRENLAHTHHRHAARLMEIGHFEEARDLVTLALELTGDDALKMILTDQHRAIEAARDPTAGSTFPEPVAEWGPDEDDEAVQAPDEQFRALCGTLPDAVRRAYMRYGADFKTGYLALNNGDFVTAERYLARALDSEEAADSYIPLELATVCMHLGRLEQARQLLEVLLGHHPDALPAYQVLCEIFWEQGAFDRADALLAAIPEALAASRAVFILKGETLFQAGRFDTAQTFYGDFLATYGWDDAIAGALARTHEALGETDQALGMYREIMDRCTGCHSRVDPLVKEKVADLSFDAGHLNTSTLELYLSLAQERPQKAFLYYARVSRIYHTLGNETEARRFSTLADRLSPRGDGRRNPSVP